MATNLFNKYIVYRRQFLINFGGLQTANEHAVQVDIFAILEYKFWMLLMDVIWCVEYDL